MAKLAVQNQMRGPNEQKLSRNLLMGMHGTKWHELSHDAKLSYEVRARQMRQEKAKQIRDKLRDITDRLEIEDDRLVASESRGSDSMRSHVCKFSTQELKQLSEFMSSGELSKSVVAALRQQANLCPEPLSEQRFVHIQGLSQLPPQSVQERSPLYMFVAHHRADFKGSVLSVLWDDGERRDYLYLWSLLNPVVCFFQCLQELPTSDVVASTLREWDQTARFDYAQVWTFSDEPVQTHDPFKDAEDDYVVMYAECAMAGQRFVVAHGNPWPIAPAMRSENARKQAQPPRANHTSIEHKRETRRVTAEDLWLEQYELGVAASRLHKFSAATHMHESAPPEHPNEESDDHERAYTLVREELEEQRHRLNERDLQDTSNQFRVTLLGGKWQLQRTAGERSTYGLRVDVIPSTDMDQFVRRFALTRSGSYEFNVFGKSGSEAMTQLFIKRYSYLFEQWQRAERPSTYPGALPHMEIPEAMLLPLRDLPKRGKQRVDTLLNLAPLEKMRSTSSRRTASASLFLTSTSS
eukprot:5660116-Amphidinium_carterae.2